MSAQESKKTEDATASVAVTSERTKKSVNKRGSRPKKPLAKPKRSFPAVSLEEAVQLPVKIKELNGGNPWPPSELAGAMSKGGSHKSSSFFYLTAAARDYGLTEGTRDAAKISLADIGRRYVYAGNQEEERKALQDAFFHVPIFNQVYSHYKGSTLPELKYLGNTLESEFGLAPDYHVDFHNLFQENCRFLQKYGEIARSETSLLNGSATSEKANIITLAAPSKGSTLRAFIALPFSEKTDRWPTGFFSEVLNTLITPAGVEAGFKVETARKEGSDVIQATIVNDLNAADLVIADLTEHNPNVLFELGMRIAFDKPVALIRAAGTAPIFDIDNLLRVFEYNPNLWKSTLESDIPKLTAHIKGTWDSRKTNKSYLQLLKEQGS